MELKSIDSSVLAVHGNAESAGNVRLPRTIRTSHSCAAVLGVVTALAVLTACGASAGGAGGMTAEKAVAKRCDASHPPAIDVRIDATKSGVGGKALAADQTSIVREALVQAAVCSGRARVSVFGSSSADSVQLFEGDIPLIGATQNARLRRVPKAVDAVVADVKRAYPPATKQLGGGGSDIIGQFQEAADYSKQVGPRYQLNILILTDGLQTAGTNIMRVHSDEAASRLASKVAVPKVTGARVTLAGLGRVSGRSPSSEQVGVLRAFYQQVCKRMSVAKCVTVTDYATEG